MKTKTTDRIKIAVGLMNGIEDSLDTYCKVKEKKGYSPTVGCDISPNDCKSSIQRRITLVRELLLAISKEL